MSRHNATALCVWIRWMCPKTDNTEWQQHVEEWQHLDNYTFKNTQSGLPWWRSGWESACRCRGHGFEPWSRRIPHAAKQLGPWATTAEPARLEPVLPTGEAAIVRGPRTAMRSGPRLPQLEKAHAQKRRPNTAKKNNKKTKTKQNKKTHKAIPPIFLWIIKYVLKVSTDILEGYTSNSHQWLICVGSEGKGSENGQYQVNQLYLECPAIYFKNLKPKWWRVNIY